MNCLRCKVGIGNPKKYEIVNCKCGATLMVIEINKAKILVDLSQDKENNHCGA